MALPAWGWVPSAFAAGAGSPEPDAERGERTVKDWLEGRAGFRG
ncbi:MAG: hypothetical protein ACRC35_06620 [Angustibacter sp.]